MQDDLTRAERYGYLATTMRRTAEQEADERRRAELLHIANQYEFLADSLLHRGNDFDYGSTSGTQSGPWLDSDCRR
jgi:hypothetical protein